MKAVRLENFKTKTPPGKSAEEWRRKKKNLTGTGWSSAPAESGETGGKDTGTAGTPPERRPTYSETMQGYYGDRYADALAENKTAADAAADQRLCRKMQPLRPFLRDRADHGCAGLRRLDERVMDLRQIRIKLRQPFLCRQTAPGAVPVGLVSGCAGTAVGKLWPGASGQQICHPVAVLDTGVSYRAHRRILPDGMQDLCPIPFRGIRPLIDRIVRCPGREAGRDLRGLRTGSVILPEMEHGVRVFLKAGQ